MTRAAIWVLELLLWAFLMPGQFLQLCHDLQEAALHHRLASDSVSVRELGIHERGHDCHSCLISHPRVSAHSAIHASAATHSEAEGRVCLIARTEFPSLRQESPNKRSPPA